MAGSTAATVDAGERARLWDLPTRLVHWTMAGLIPFSWWSATHAHLGWHRLSGYALLGLLAFRLQWGVFGSSTARFAGFLAGPRTIAAYLGGRLGRVVVGHNPLGGWSVAAMLSVLAVQIGLGLFSWHHKVFWVLVALIGLHLLAILVYAVRRRNLVGPMITGVARLAPGSAAPRMAPAWRIAAAVVLAGVFAWFIAQGLSLPRL